MFLCPRRSSEWGNGESWILQLRSGWLIVQHGPVEVFFPHFPLLCFVFLSNKTRKWTRRQIRSDFSLTWSHLSWLLPEWKPKALMKFVGLLLEMAISRFPFLLMVHITQNWIVVITISRKVPSIEAGMQRSEQDFYLAKFFPLIYCIGNADGGKSTRWNRETRRAQKFGRRFFAGERKKEERAFNSFGSGWVPLSKKGRRKKGKEPTNPARSRGICQ